MRKFMLLSAPPYEESKNASCLTRLAALDSLLSEFLKIPDWTLKILDFLRSKSEIVYSPFLR